MPQDPADPHHDAAAAAQLIEHFRHRLLSLEAELHDFACAGQLPLQEHHRRLAAVQAMRKKLAVLAVQAAPSPTAADHDWALPLLGSCTPTEALLCLRYLKERRSGLRELTAAAEKVLAWLNAAVAGQTNVVLLTLRLSSLRRLLADLGRRRSGLRARASQLNDQAERLLSAGASPLHDQAERLPRDGVSPPNTQAERLLREGASPLHDQAERWLSAGGSPLSACSPSELVTALRQLFTQTEGTLLSIAKLKAMIIKAEQKAQAMAAWLKREEAALNAQRPAMQAPTPVAIAEVAYELQPVLHKSQLRERRRRLLAERAIDPGLAAGRQQLSVEQLARAAKSLPRAAKGSP